MLAKRINKIIDDARAWPLTFVLNNGTRVELRHPEDIMVMDDVVIFTGDPLPRVRFVKPAAVSEIERPRAKRRSR